MPTLEIRRHSYKGDSDHLSHEGIQLARRLGSEMGPFELVITSHLLRAVETACAMGFAINETNQDLALLPSEVLAEVNWQGGYPEFARAISCPGPTQDFGFKLKQICTSLMNGLTDIQQVLIISHGGLIEAATVACCGSDSVSSWNFAAGNCEGARIHYHEGSFQRPKPLRLSPGSFF